MATSSSLKLPVFQVPNVLDDQTWAVIAPHFKNGQCPVPDWYEATNQDGKNLLVLAAESARVVEMKLFLNLIREGKCAVAPGTTTYNNVIWIAIAGIGTDEGKAFLDCLLSFPYFVREHAFAVMVNERGQSPVHPAALQGWLQLFKTLEGVDRAGLIERMKRCVSKDGETPLDLAMDTNNLGMIELLIGLYTLPASMDKRGQPKDNILHRALKLKTPNMKVIEMILNKNSAYLTQPNQNGKTPLQYISGKQDVNLQSIATSDSKEAVQQTKDFLISKLFESNLSYAELRKELGEEAVGKELYLDVSFMSQPTESFKMYLEKLGTLKVPFSNTLRAVRLPDLQCCEYDGVYSDLQMPESLLSRKPCSGKYGIRSTFEALDVFRFLKQKGVRHVKNVRVLDCVIHPHSISKIKECLENLDVRSLEWRKRDLSLTLVRTIAPNVTKLHLYSSGNEDVLHFWEMTGLANLKKIQSLTITISQCEFDPNDIDGIERFRVKWETAFKTKVPRCSIIMETPPNIAQLSAVAGLHHSLSKSGFGKTMFTEMDQVLDFIRAVSNNEDMFQTQSARENPIKVAILDTGLSLFNLPGMLHKPVGRSFVEDSESSSDTHWHSPQCSHGNKLAQLILRCNPHCKLYIGKVQSGPDATSVHILSAIKALEWVAEEKVDIVCMSWTINESSMEQKTRYRFEDAIEKAAALTFCSLSDEGRIHNPGTSYPAGFKKAFKISSYSPLHRESNDSEHHPEAFYFPADDLDVHPIPDYFGESKTTTEELFKGSSYATALAAGMAAFVLQCVQYAFHPGTQPPLSMEQPESVKDMIIAYKRVKMERLFIGMCDQGESRHFVKPWTAFRHDWSLATEDDTQRLAVLRALLERD